MTTTKTYTVDEVARRHRTSKVKIRALIARGLLQAVDLGQAGIGRSQLRILPEDLARFEESVKVGAAKPKRRRQPTEAIDPDVEKFLN